MELRDYLRVLRQRWLTIVLSILVITGIALLLTIRATPQYESTARLFVSTSESNTTDAYQGGLFSQQRVKSYSSLMTGGEMAGRVAEKLDDGTTAEQVMDRLSASVVPDTVVLSVSATDPSAKHAKAIAQTAAEVFTEYVAELETPPGKSTAPVKASITDAATSPGAPVSPKPLRNIALAIVLGAMLGLGLAVLRDTLDNRVKTPQDLADATDNAPDLGHVPFDKSADRKPLSRDLPTNAPRVEAYRVIRTNLQFLSVDADQRTIVVTSPLPGEGKSTTASNIALAIAQAGHTVVLVEADLRKPMASDYFRLEPTVGITSVLLGQVDLDEALQYAAPRCDVLASGPTPPNPTELLQSDAMQRMLDTLKTKYEYVIIDAPPVLPIADAALLAANAQGAILVTRFNSSTVEQVRGAVERLDAVGATLLGTILNRTPQSRRGSSYGYGYGYGYGPEKSTRTTLPPPPPTSNSHGGRRASRKA